MTMEFVTDDTVKAMTNGTPQDRETFVDNRLRIEVDPKQIETWELMAMETGRLEDTMLVFTRYLYRGERQVSPDLPNDPIDELPKAERARLKDSAAYKELKRLKLGDLQAACRSFLDQANAGF